MQNVILIIDDDPAILEMTQLVLAEEGYTVVTATNGEDGLVAFACHAPDLVLLDYMMPGFNGDAFLEDLAVTRLRRGVKIVLFTAAADAEQLAARLHVDDLIKKPFELDQLLATVERLLTPTGKQEVVVC